MAKRTLAIILALAMAAFMGIAFAGCGSADVSDHALVGTWTWNTNAAFTYVFNADGTGVRGGAGMPRQGFSWSIPGNGRLNIDIDRADVVQGTRRAERWDYSIAGNVVTIESRQESGVRFSYTRVDAEPEVTTTTAPAQVEPASIVGNWNWLDSVYYTFNADGTGVRDVSGQFEAPSAIAWTTVDGTLYICITPDLCEISGHAEMSTCIEPEMWSYALGTNSLTITSQQVAGMEFTYTR
ncbi:MAG: DUF5640 domain-containing protein [Oscillospiraceae bacterium]|nr:DUF5640 domain-containing protein [Oscillospiraceae bacterium]